MPNRMSASIAALSCCLLTLCQAQPALFSHSIAPPRKHEVRAVWLTTIGGIDWPRRYAQSQQSMTAQQKELADILDRLQAAGVNTVLLQTRIRGTVIYPSRYEPWDGCLSGTPGRSPGYDALAFAIEECHRRGMELHAWVVTMPVGKWNAHGCRQLRAREPQLPIRIGAEGYMNPERKQTGDYLAKLCEEITERYDIDGIHLDYIRYPETWNIKVPLQEGRRHITEIVKAIHDKVKARKPWVKMSCAPIGKADDLTRYWSHGWNAYSRVCQDAQGWLKQGLMDMLFPMMYFKDNGFFPFAIDWKEQADGKPVVPGLGIYFMSPAEKDWPLETITREMAACRNYGLGHAYFRSKFFTDNTKGIYDFASAVFDPTPALVPPMTWASSTQPEAPTDLRLTKDEQGFRLSLPVDSPFTYNLYASSDYPVDTEQGAHLLKARAVRETLPDDGHYYAVTRSDRYDNESKPVQLSDPPTSQAPPLHGLLPHDGRRLALPDAVSQADAAFILIADMQGLPLLTFSVRDKTLDISTLASGIYQVRTLDKHHNSHRIGLLRIKKQM